MAQSRPRNASLRHPPPCSVARTRLDVSACTRALPSIQNWTPHRLFWCFREQSLAQHLRPKGTAASLKSPRGIVRCCAETQNTSRRPLSTTAKVNSAESISTAAQANSVSPICTMAEPNSWDRHFQRAIARVLALHMTKHRMSSQRCALSSRKPRYVDQANHHRSLAKTSLFDMFGEEIGSAVSRANFLGCDVHVSYGCKKNKHRKLQCIPRVGMEVCISLIAEAAAVDRKICFTPRPNSPTRARTNKLWQAAVHRRLHPQSACT